MMQEGPKLNQLNIIVRDMDATVAFYRQLGLDVDAEPGAFHVNVPFPNGMLLDFDTVAFAQQWGAGLIESNAGAAVIGFGVTSRDEVDARYNDLVAAGYRGRQPPFNAFWGARYAIVDDPDGNGIGLMSPIEKERKFWPPRTLPSAGS
jgi:catechol 2,3-dioxygenase-like lactoylglutathione lyase family enzyme